MQYAGPLETPGHGASNVEGPGESIQHTSITIQMNPGRHPTGPRLLPSTSLHKYHNRPHKLNNFTARAARRPACGAPRESNRSQKPAGAPKPQNCSTRQAPSEIAPTPCFLQRRSNASVEINRGESTKKTLHPLCKRRTVPDSGVKTDPRVPAQRETNSPSNRLNCKENSIGQPFPRRPICLLRLRWGQRADQLAREHRLGTDGSLRSYRRTFRARASTGCRLGLLCTVPRDTKNATPTPSAAPSKYNPHQSHGAGTHCIEYTTTNAGTYADRRVKHRARQPALKHRGGELARAYFRLPPFSHSVHRG